MSGIVSVIDYLGDAVKTAPIHHVCYETGCCYPTVRRIIDKNHNVNLKTLVKFEAYVEKFCPNGQFQEAS